MLLPLHVTELLADETSEENGTTPSKDRLRALQLNMRVREVYETYHSFNRLVSGRNNGKMIFNNGKAEEQKINDFVTSIQGRVDLDDVYLTGHSFGGGTMVSSMPPPHKCVACTELLSSCISCRHLHRAIQL